MHENWHGGLTLLSITAGIVYIITQASTFEETAYPFHEEPIHEDHRGISRPKFQILVDPTRCIFLF